VFAIGDIMRKTYIVNNIITILTQALVVALLVSYPYTFHFFNFDINSIVDYDTLVLLLITIFLYLLCGFLLKPVEKRSFLSVVALIVVLLLTMFTGYGYMMINPIVFYPVELFVYNSYPHGYQTDPEWLTDLLVWTWYFFSAALPSIIIYIGILLRKLVGFVSKQRAQRDNTQEDT